MGYRPGSTMIATLGGQPQVVTFALDALLDRGETIVEVVLIHFAPCDDRKRHALECLKREFLNEFYAHAGRSIRLRSITLQDHTGGLHDIVDERTAQIVRDQMAQILQQEKAQGRPLHVVLAGGRRILALMLLLTAMIHLDYSDRVWHLYTPPLLLENVRNGRRMHARPEDGVRLIEVPFPRWGVDFPAFRHLSIWQPADATSPQDVERFRAVWKQLTKAQRRVLHAIAQGHNPQEIAQHLGIATKTVGSHLEAIKDLCREIWGIPRDRRLFYHDLRDWFRPFQSLMIIEESAP